MLLIPRLCVAQDRKPHGISKIQAVHNFSWSHGKGKRKRKRSEIKSGSVNGHYVPDDELKHDHLDDLAATMSMHFEMVSEVSVHTVFCIHVGCL